MVLSGSSRQFGGVETQIFADLQLQTIDLSEKARGGAGSADQQALGKIDKESPHPLALRDILTDSAMYHATVFPLRHVAKSGTRMNGGFMVLRQEIFSYMKDGEELVEEPFHRLIGASRLMVYPHDGYWACMDTFKEKQDLEDLFSRGRAPWAVWNDGREIKK